MPALTDSDAVADSVLPHQESQNNSNHRRAIMDQEMDLADTADADALSNGSCILSPG